MDRILATQFDLAAWSFALDKIGAVAHLSVSLYGAAGQIIVGPAPATPLSSLFLEHAFDPGLFAECVRRCLAQPIGQRPAVIVAAPAGLAVVGASLAIDGAIAGAAVAGYAVVDFCDSVAIARLARDGGVPFNRLWDLARHQQPVPARRLSFFGELLQVLGDALLREAHRAVQCEAAAVDLTTALAAKDEFLAVLSHELRSPLTPILGWAQILKGENGEAQRLRAAEAIERNAQLQVRLVDDLLEMNRMTRGSVVLHRRVLSLGDVLRDAVDAIADIAAGKGVGLQFVDAGQPLCVNADADRLQQIFRNVLSNAVKFTGKGGSVQVTLEKTGDRATVRIRDTGEGIGPEFLPFVFEMFRQQAQGRRREHGGLGIGLALVKALVEAHGGAVSVASDGEGRGTEVTVSLAIVVDRQASVAPVPAGQPVLHELQGIRVLAVDDMEDMRDFMRVTLERFGAEVVSAVDGLDALDVLSREQVGLVLCDLRMPRMDGFEFLRELERRQGAGHIPVIAVSALAGSADHLRTAAAGFAGHLDKPFDDQHLRAMVGAIVARHA